MKLADFIAAHGFTDETAASALAISRPYLTRLRRAERSPSLEIALRIERWTKGAVRPCDLVVEALIKGGHQLVEPAA